MSRLQNMGGEAEVNLLLSHRKAGQLFIIFLYKHTVAYSLALKGEL